MPDTDDVALAPDGEEFEAIRSLVAVWKEQGVAHGIGDDAAILGVPRGEQICASTDAAVENVHFRREWLSLADIGYRATSAALSDLAAMAAKPLGVLVAFALPAERGADLIQVAVGIGESARDAGAVIVGGNISLADVLSITTTVIGSAYAPLRRAGARVGDVLYVTGDLGRSGSALRELEEGRRASDFMMEKFARPRPRIREARWLADHGATAAIDISDGLVGDIPHLATASGVLLECDFNLLPREYGVSLDDAATSGEEYELLVTAPAHLDTAAFRERFGIRLTEVGKVLEGTGIRFSVPGDIKRFSRHGHDHLSR